MLAFMRTLSYFLFEGIRRIPEGVIIFPATDGNRVSEGREDGRQTDIERPKDAKKNYLK